MKKLLLLLCLLPTFSFAQDKIFFRDGLILEAKVIEVGIAEVRYRNWHNMDGPVYVRHKNDIEKIVYENGLEDFFQEISVVPTTPTGRPIYRTDRERKRKEFSGNPRTDFPLGLSGYLLGPTSILAFDVGYFVTPSLEMSGGFGLLGTYAGMRYHFGGGKGNPNTFFVGANANFRMQFETGNFEAGAYLPFGVSFISPSGFFAVPEAAVMFRLYDDPFPYLGVRIGGRFH
jgi:hypothetical protein